MSIGQEDQCLGRVIHEDRIRKARKLSLASRETERVALLFKAMGDETRARILWALEHGEMCVCDLAAHLGVTESAISHQLRFLRQLHLVSNRRQGSVLYYRLDDEHVSQLFRLALEHIREQVG